MKQVTMFIEPDWAFGVIHYELMKRLYSHGYNCSLLPWNRSYTVEELQELDTATDLYITNPHGWRFLRHVYKTASPEKCILVSHSKMDMEELIHHHGIQEFDEVKKHCCVSEWLMGVSAELGIKRTPVLTPLGINYHQFFAEPSKELRTIGYAGAWESCHPLEIKRVHLIQKVIENTGLNLKIAQNYHHSFVTMPGFYRAVDCILVASSQEGAGLPVLEAGAAGRLVMSTPVGHWNRVGDSGGITLPFDENDFVNFTTNVLRYYMNNTGAYVEKCLQIREHAKSYDWDSVLHYWLDSLS